MVEEHKPAAPMKPATASLGGGHDHPPQSAQAAYDQQNLSSSHSGSSLMHNHSSGFNSAGLVPAKSGASTADVYESMGSPMGSMSSTYTAGAFRRALVGASAARATSA